MAKADIRIASPAGHSAVPTIKWQTQAGGTDILAGEPVKLSAAGSEYVVPLASLDLTIGTDTAFVGIAKSDSDHTASADGVVEVYMPLPGLVYGMKATTAANVDTQAEIDALVGNRVVMTLAGGVYTLDEDAADAATNAFYILGGDPDRAELLFSCRLDATFLAA